MKITGRLVKSVTTVTPTLSKFFGDKNPYENLYESLAQSLPPENSIGGGDFQEIGKILLSVLIDSGLKPSHSLFDLGCGTGRLSIQALEYLENAKYYGSDISVTMLNHAKNLTSHLGKNPTFIHQTEPNFTSLPIFEFICAFSVFTHMEPEDTFNYLKSALAISNKNTKFVLSVIPLESKLGVNIFTNAASLTLKERWQGVRNIATTLDFFEEIAKLAGWKIVATYDGETKSIPLKDSKSFGQLGQTVIVLVPVI